MLRTERVVIYTLLGVALLAAAGQGFGLRLTNAAVANPAAAPDPARIAICDIYELVERMVDGSSYQLTRAAEQERIKTVLRPLEEELDKLQQEIKAGSPEDPATVQKTKTFENKRASYGRQTQIETEAYSRVVSGQFNEAYSKIAAETKKVGDSLGYGYVLAQKKGPLTAENPQQLVEQFLGRPLASMPAEVDITEQVRAAMKLSTAPASKTGEPKK